MTCKKSASANKLSLQTLMSRSRQCLAHGADTSCWLSYFARGIPTNVPFMYCVRLASWVLVTRLSADQTAWHQHVSWSPQLSTSLTITKLDFTHLGLIGKTISLKIHHLETQHTSVRSVSCGCWMESDCCLQCSVWSCRKHIEQHEPTILAARGKFACLKYFQILELIWGNS